MGLLLEEKEKIESILQQALRHKFKHYTPESKYMPFHTRLLGKDRMALFSFIHSLNTNFGTSIFEPVSAFLGKQHFASVELQATAGEYITTGAQTCIQTIMDNLISGDASPSSVGEIESLRKVCRKGKVKRIKSIKIDIKLISYDKSIYLIDLKTAKPNKGSFISFKRNFLEWIASILYESPDANVYAFLGIPYNPYHPKQYARWTLKGMFDLKYELKVGDEYWNFLNGSDIYNELLDIFENVGLKMRDEIDGFFSTYRI